MNFQWQINKCLCNQNEKELSVENPEGCNKIRNDPNFNGKWQKNKIERSALNPDGGKGIVLYFFD